MTSSLVHQASSRTPPARRHRGWWPAILLTSLGVAVYFPIQYYGHSLEEAARSGTAGLAAVYATRPVWVQVAFYLHITFSGIALLVGGFQFSAAIRRRARRVHRWIGRVYVVSALAGAAAAFVMAFFNSAGLLGFFGFGTAAVLWFAVTYRGYRAIRRRDVAAHQAWMIRSFALAYAAVILRVLLVIFMVALHVIPGLGLGEAQIYADSYAPLPFLSWLPNLVIAEILICRRGLPGLRWSATARPAGDAE